MPIATGVPAGTPVDSTASLVNPLPQRVPCSAIFAPDTAEVFVSKMSQLNAAEIVGGPAALMGQISPLAGESAHGAGEVSCCSPGQEVGQVKELSCVVIHVGPIFLQPEELR
ncbi:hypothetical protein A8A01_00180 [Ewingella americana]|nr:hypothetical protein A8A01_00180 [Ewingella americana]